jgi:hypothetical protein
MLTDRPLATIVIPAYNVAKTISETLTSALSQTAANYEVVVIDDGSTDETPALLARFQDPRLRVIRQENRGLAGARNSGIHAARGRFIGFLDGDDLWMPTKLEAHTRHLQIQHRVGVSFSGSRLIDDHGVDIGLSQSPKLLMIQPEDVLMRNPVGNGSAPVIRSEVFDAIAWRPEGEKVRDWWFDETFRQSEDIECWMRIALTTAWHFEGLPENLTLYRVNPGGLSANLTAQHATWERMLAKVEAIAPDFAAEHSPAARAYQMRYLARRAVSSRDGAEALGRMISSLRASLIPLRSEPVKTLTTLAAAVALTLIGGAAFSAVERAAFTLLRRTA